jgi:hypothetical protein
LDIAKIFLIRGKGDMRGVVKDIHKIETEYADLGFDPVEYLCIYTNRDGIYDSLPEGLFHQSNNRKQKSKEDILHEIKTQKEEELSARKYFRPFEMLLDKTLADILIYEQKYYNTHPGNTFSDIIGKYWSLLELLTFRQKLLFIKLIPALEEVSRSLTTAAMVMKIIMDCPVTIKEGDKSIHKLDAKEIIPLGKWKLGVNSVIGKTRKSDNPDLDITAGPMSLEKMQLFLPGKINDRVLKSLINITIPFDRNTKVKYVVAETENKFRLSNDTHSAYLGINTKV